MEHETVQERLEKFVHELFCISQTVHNATRELEQAHCRAQDLEDEVLKLLRKIKVREK